MRPFKLDPIALEVSTFEPATPNGTPAEALVASAYPCPIHSYAVACPPTDPKICVTDPSIC